MIKNVLFDLDDTLLDFHKAEAEAIRFTLKEFGIDPSDENVQLYSRINRSCWAKLETGEFTRDEVLHRRFDILFDTLGIAGDSHRTQKVYEYRLSLGAYYLDGAKELLDTLYGKYKLYLATNGIVNVQSRRIPRLFFIVSPFQMAAALQQLLQGIFTLPAVGSPQPIAFQPDLLKTATVKEGSTCHIAFGDVAPQLMQPQHLTPIAAKRLDRLTGIASTTILLVGNQDPDAGTSMQRIVAKQIDRPDGSPLLVLDDEALLAGLRQVELLFIQKATQRMAREGHQRTTHRPNSRVVLPPIHQLDILRLDRPQTDRFPLDVHLQTDNLITNEHRYTPCTGILRHLREAEFRILID